MDAASRRSGRRDESEWAVLLTVAVALVIGLVIQGLALGRMARATVGSNTLSYPASWVRTTENGALFAAADLNRGGLFGARVSVLEVPNQEILPNESGPVDAGTAWSLARGAGLVGYRVLGIEERTVGGRPAARVEYAYLADSPQGSASGAMPALMRAVDTVVAGDGRYHVLSFAAESGEFPRLVGGQFPRFRSVYEDVLASWRIA